MPSNALLAALLLAANTVVADTWQMETFEYMDDQKIVVYVSESDIAANPEWQPEEGAPPLTIGRLLEIVRISTATDPRLGEARISEIKLKQISHHEKQHRWYYLVKLKSGNGGRNAWHYIAVLLNGKVVQAIAEPLPIK